MSLLGKMVERSFCYFGGSEWFRVFVGDDYGNRMT